MTTVTFQFKKKKMIDSFLPIISVVREHWWAQAAVTFIPLFSVFFQGQGQRLNRLSIFSLPEVMSSIYEQDGLRCFMNHTHVHTCTTRDQVKEQERGGKDLLPQVRTRRERDRLKTWLGDRSLDLHAQGPGFKSTHQQIKRVGAEST